MPTSTLLFWLFAVLLLALTLALLLPVLWRRRSAATAPDLGSANAAIYRDQLREAENDLEADLITPERFAQTRAEIQRRVLEDAGAAAAAPATAPAVRSPMLGWVLLLVVPLASVATYVVIGSPQSLVEASAEAAQGHVTPEQIESMLATLAGRLKEKPDDPEGWAMLGRAYTALERFDDGVAALRKAQALVPDNADVLTDLADAIARTRERSLAGEPAELLERALKINPQQGKALALAGSAAFEAGNFARARELWQRLLALVPADSEIARSIAAGIERANAQMAAASPGAASAPRSAAASAPATAAAAPAVAVTGSVTLSPALAARAAPGDTLFVFARAVQGPRAPLAVVRKTVAELPLAFSLDDSMAMTPALRLSAFEKVEIVARISKSGQAATQSGDLIGQSAPVAPGAKDVKIVIDTVQP